MIVDENLDIEGEFQVSAVKWTVWWCVRGVFQGVSGGIGSATFYASAGFCLCCGTKDVVVTHPLFKGSLCRICRVRSSAARCARHHRSAAEPVSDPPVYCPLSRTTSQKLCSATMRMDTSRTAPSVATAWRSSCVEMTVAAGQAPPPTASWF